MKSNTFSIANESTLSEMSIQGFCPFFLVIAFVIDMYNFFTYSLYKPIASIIYCKYLLLLLTSFFPFLKMPFGDVKSWEIEVDIYTLFVLHIK